MGSEPGSGLEYTGADGDSRVISREIYQGKTFEDWDDMEANVRRLARKAGFKVVKVRMFEIRQLGLDVLRHYYLLYIVLLSIPTDCATVEYRYLSLTATCR